jgi:hypothetical protein
MKKCIIYSITIYILLTMSIVLQKPAILTDTNGNFKSWNYLQYKMTYGLNDLRDLICLPTVLIMCSLISFLIARQLIDSDKN